MSKIGIYTYGGSGNHGCEALLRTLYLMMKEEELTVYTQRPEDDKKYLGDLSLLFHSAMQTPSFIDKVMNKIQGEIKRIQRLYRPTIAGSQDKNMMISIGGDNYCYDDYLKVPGSIKAGFPAETKKVLLGCSIDEKALQDQAVIKDLESYTLITAREPITYQLLSSRLKSKNVKYYPDSAFFLPGNEAIKMPSKDEFVGLNISPMIIQAENDRGTVLKNTHDLIEHILQETPYSILLIPHVVWSISDDRSVLKDLYENYKDTNRVYLVEDCTCCDLKGYIAKCRYFIGARTHATIAAYSSCVPTIVLGYSIKSKGIAIDLFGTTEHYVVPVQNLKDGDLVSEFCWLMDHEDEIRNNLQNKMPAYIQNAKDVEKELKKLL